MKFSRFRRLSFGAMFIISLLFCGVIVWQLQGEISRFRNESAMSGRYLSTLHDCQENLGRTGETLSRFLREDSLAAILTFHDNLNRLQQEFRELVLREQSVRTRPLAAPETFESPLLRMRSALAVLELEKDETLRTEAVGVLCEDFALTARILQGRMRYEFSPAGLGSNQAGYMTENLLPVVILYLLIMTAFLIAASYGGSEILAVQLRRISEGTRRISRGEFGFRFTRIKENDEIDGVMADFNHMAVRLEEQSRLIRQHHADLLAATEKLMEVNRHKDRFLANMSHELRTPLNAVIGFAELLRDRANTMLPDRLHRYASQIVSASEHLLALISDLLEVARIDAGVRTPEWSEFDLRGCIENTVTMLKPLADRKNLILEWKSPPNACIVKADRRFICQILINLMNNALKFTHEGRVSVQMEATESESVIRVTDTGIGIAPDEQDKIFQDFHRVESNLSGSYEGVGLGLTLSRRLVEFHGGTLSVTSQPGVGSTFTVRFPTRPPIQPQGEL